MAIGGEEAVCGQVGWPGADGGKQQQDKEARSSKGSLKEEQGGERENGERSQGESFRSDEEGTEKSNNAGPERAEKHKQHCAEGKRPPSVLSSQQTPGLKCTYRGLHSLV